MLRRLFKTLFLVVLLFAGGLSLLAAMTPDTYRVERSISISVAADRVYYTLMAHRKWNAWFPWKEAEVETRILDTIPNAKVRFEARFLERDSKSEGEFVITPETGGSRVSWVMTGERRFHEKALWILLRMEKEIGNDFETGLTALKTELERKSP